MATDLMGSSPLGYDEGFGGVPQVPNPNATAGTAIGGNFANLGSLYGLSGPLNAFQQSQAPMGLQANLPGYQGLIGQSSANIGNLLKGEIPPDVINQMMQQAAERGVATGSPGSPNSNAAYLRALGLTSLGLMGQGEQALTGAIHRTPQAPIFDPTRMFISPEQQQAAQMAANKFRAAPNPAAAHRAALGDAMAGMSAGQHAGGGGGGYYGGGGGGGARDALGFPIYQRSEPNYMNPAPVGALGPFDTWDPSSWQPVQGALQAGGADPGYVGSGMQEHYDPSTGHTWVFDPNNYEWVNNKTGEAADTPPGYQYPTAIEDNPQFTDEEILASLFDDGSGDYYDSGGGSDYGGE